MRSRSSDVSLERPVDSLTGEWRG